MIKQKCPVHGIEVHPVYYRSKDGKFIRVATYLYCPEGHLYFVGKQSLFQPPVPTARMPR